MIAGAGAAEIARGIRERLALVRRIILEGASMEDVREELLNAAGERPLPAKGDA